MITMAIESAEETGIGKRFVEETLKRLAGELKITAAGFKWRDDFPGPYITTLVFAVGNTDQTGSIEFRIRHLEDCRNPSNRPVRAALEQQIRDSLQELSQRHG
jgi:hypothetical protein